MTVSQRVFGAGVYGFFNAVGGIHAVANGIAVRPEMVGELFINEDDRRDALFVAVVKVAAANQGDVHSREETGGDVDLVRRDEGFTRLGTVAFGDDDAVVVIATQGDCGGGAYAGDARNSFEGAEHAAHKDSQFGLSFIGGSRGAETGGKYACRIEAGVGGEEVAKAGEEQAGGRAQEKGEGNLGDDQSLTELARAGSGGASTAAVFQRAD